jgi:hypothetical protein
LFMACTLIHCAQSYSQLLLWQASGPGHCTIWKIAPAAIRGRGGDAREVRGLQQRDEGRFDKCSSSMCTCEQLAQLDTTAVEAVKPNAAQ